MLRKYLGEGVAGSDKLVLGLTLCIGVLFTRHAIYATLTRVRHDYIFTTHLMVYLKSHVKVPLDHLDPT